MSSLNGFQIGRNLTSGKPQYFGKYRATVTKTNDPLKMGRIKVKCPKVLGDFESNWCLPCLPPGYQGIPKVGDLVWIEFEEGNPDLPIWCGVWYKEQSYTANVNNLIIQSNGTVSLNGSSITAGGRVLYP